MKSVTISPLNGKPELFCSTVARKFDGRVQKVIEIIDEAKLISKYKICSKFNDIVLDVDKLSAECKNGIKCTIYSDKVFCLKECGNNALEVLYNFETGNVYSDYALIPFEMEVVSVQTPLGKKFVIMRH